MRKTKINCYGNLNQKDVTDKIKVWKIVKSFLSDKSINSEKIHLNENGEMINGESKKAGVLDEFFSKISEYKNLNPNFEKVKDPVFKANLK